MKTRLYLIRMTNPNGLIWAYWKSDKNALEAFEDAADALKDRLRAFEPAHIRNTNPSYLVFSNECPEGK